MPVTARLSQKFYERFGDDIAGELVDWFNAVDLTYQTQLKETNEVNWERFKATLLAETASIRGEVRAGLAELRGELLGKIGGLRDELHGEIGSLRDELRGEIGALGKEISGLRDEMHAMRNELMKWMFIFWSGSVVSLGGLMFALLRIQ